MVISRLSPSFIAHVHKIPFSQAFLYLALLVLCGASIQYVYSSKRNRASAPIAGVQKGKSLRAGRKCFRRDAKSMLQEGYTKYKGRPFYVPTLEGDRLMIPPYIVDGLKNLPDSEADAVEPMFQMFESKYTLLGSRETLHRKTIKNHLYQNIDDLKDELLDEVNVAISDTIGPCNDWTEILIAESMVQTVSRVSSRLFGGLSLSRNQAWIGSAIGSADDAIIAARKLKAWPSILKPAVAYFVPELARCKQHYVKAREIIVPLLESREGLSESQKPRDFLQWMTQEAQGSERDKTFLAELQLDIAFTAFFTTTAAIVQLLFDLCSRLEYVEALREEVSVITRQGTYLNRTTLGKLYKLDSFMKESQRFNPLMLITFTRYMKRDTYIEGVFIPKHTVVGVPAQAMSMDPELYPDPTRFDGFRFERIRNQSKVDPAVAAAAQWASSTLESMPFGYGRVNCTGRQLASMEIKMIMVKILMNYDLGELPHGRPKSDFYDYQVAPDRTVKISMKRRS